MQNPDRVIGRDELLRAVWNGRIVSDSAITNRITAARRAIGDSGETQRLIRTVPRRGIRFVASVGQQVDRRQAGPPRGVMPERSRPIWMAAASALIGAAIALVVAWPQLTSRQTTSRPVTAGLLVSGLPLKPPGVRVGDPWPTVLASRDARLALDAPPPLTAKASAGTAKLPREAATAAAPPVVPILSAAAAPAAVAAPQVQAPPPPVVTVITPAPAEQAAPANSPSGGAGVDEAKWQVIPCATARIDLGAGAKCEAGLSVGGGLCDIARQVTMVTNAHYQIEADAKIFDPAKVTAAGYPGRNCTIWSGFRHLPDDFKDMNQMTRDGATSSKALGRAPPRLWKAGATASRSSVSARPGMADMSGWCTQASILPQAARCKTPISMRCSQCYSCAPMTRSAICAHRCNKQNASAVQGGIKPCRS